MNGGWIPFSCFIFSGLLLCVPAHCHTLMSWATPALSITKKCLLWKKKAYFSPGLVVTDGRPATYLLLWKNVSNQFSNLQSQRVSGAHMWTIPWSLWCFRTSILPIFPILLEYLCRIFQHLSLKNNCVEGQLFELTNAFDFIRMSIALTKTGSPRAVSPQGGPVPAVIIISSKRSNWGNALYLSLQLSIM